MGVWGVKLFDNDVTADIRDAFLALYETGICVRKIKKLIITEYADLFKSEDEGPLAKLALCTMLLEYGELSEIERKECLSYLQAGGDLSAWENLTPKQINAREIELRKLQKIFEVPSPRGEIERKIKTYTYIGGQVFALPICHERGINLGLSGEYVLFYVCDEPSTNKNAINVRIKLTKNGVLPKDTAAFNALPFIQLSATAFSDRFRPFRSENEVPIEFVQEYHPDSWGELPEFTIEILDAKHSSPPKALKYLGRYENIQPPAYDYKVYPMPEGTMWKFAEEFVINRYRIFTLKQAARYRRQGDGSKPLKKS